MISYLLPVHQALSERGPRKRVLLNDITDLSILPLYIKYFKGHIHTY